MDKSKIVIWWFPIITTTLLFLIWFSESFGRPLSGLLLGLVLGSLIGLFTFFMYDGTCCNDVCKGFQRGDYKPIESFEDWLRVPYWFFLIWLHPIAIAGGCVLSIIAIIGGLALIIYLIYLIIANGL
jgi:hypothetical protein